MENAAILEVGNFRVRVQSACRSELLARRGLNHDVLVHLEVPTLHVDVEGLGAVQSMSVRALAILELERQDAHSDEVRAVDALVGLSDHGAHALQVGTLGSPVAGGTRTVLFAGEEDRVLALLLVPVSGVEDSHFFAAGHVDSGGTDLLDHLVNEAHVSESAPSHDLVITSAGAVRVEVLLSDAALCQVASGRGVLGDLTSRGNVVCGDRVSHVDEAVGALDVRDGVEFVGRVLEEGRVVHVGGLVVPGVLAAGGGLESLPHFATLQNVVVGCGEHLGLDHTVGHGADLVAGGPDVTEEDGLAFLVVAEGRSLKVEIDGAS